MRVLTAAELAGTTFPVEVMIQPDGIPTVEVGAVALVARVVDAIHGQPVLVAVLPLVLPMPAGMDGDADVAAGTSALTTVAAFPPALPLILPPTAWMDPQLPDWSPYVY